jgi:hypothetical protein
MKATTPPLSEQVPMSELDSDSDSSGSSTVRADTGIQLEENSLDNLKSVGVPATSTLMVVIYEHCLAH